MELQSDPNTEALHFVETPTDFDGPWGNSAAVEQFLATGNVSITIEVAVKYYNIAVQYYIILDCDLDR